MTAEDIAKAREIIAAATPGPWRVERSGYLVRTVRPTYDETEKIIETIHIGDAPFSVAARTGWPEALDEVERLEKECVARHDDFIKTYSENCELRAENELMQKGMHALNVGLAARNAENALLKSVAEAAENMLPYLAEHGWQWDSELFQAIKAWRGEK